MKKKLLVYMTIAIFGLSLILSIPTYSATSFDNSQFEDMTEEEKAQAELEKKQLDAETYEEKLAARPESTNFTGMFTWEDEDAYHSYEKKLYETVRDSSTMNELQKETYYEQVLGSDEFPGITDKLYDFTEEIATYMDVETSSTIYDTNEAVSMLLEFNKVSYREDNVGFISDASQLIDDLSTSIVPVRTANLTEQEQSEMLAEQQLFIAQFDAFKENVEFLAIPKKAIVMRLLNTTVLFNLACIGAVIGLFAVRFKTIKAQQDYAWGKFRPATLLVIPLVATVAFVFLTYMFGLQVKDYKQGSTIVVNGEVVQSSDRIPLTEASNQEVYLVSSDSTGNIDMTSFNITVTDDYSMASSVNTELPEYFESDKSGPNYKAETGNSSVQYINAEDEYAYTTYGNVISELGISAPDKAETDENSTDLYKDRLRNEFILPWPLPLIFPSLLLGSFVFFFILMPDAMVKMYIDELYTINKFCGFLSYNMAYRSNARVLIEETLQSLEACKFAEDFAIIFFEKDRAMVDKIQDISQIYSYKFFEMYLGIVNIIFDEGVSESTLKSLEIIQQFGDEYYTQADMFFKAKKGGRGAVMMIIVICMVIPIMTKNNVGSLFTLFTCTTKGYIMTNVVYLVWIGIIAMLFNTYKDNKIVRKEGRYV